MLTPEQFAEYAVAERLGILAGDEWIQTGLICSTIHNELEICRGQMAGKRVPEENYHSPGDYLPAAMKPKKDETKKVPDAEEIGRIYGDNRTNGG